jgi:hypothetical protein
VGRHDIRIVFLELSAFPGAEDDVVITQGIEHGSLPDPFAEIH